MTANRSTGVCETYVMRWHRCRCTDMRWIRFTCERRVSLMEMHPEEMPSCVPVAGMRLVHPFGWSRDFAGKRHSFGRSIRIGCWCSPVMPFFLLSSTATAANPVFLCHCGWVLWPVSAREASVVRVGAVMCFRNGSKSRISLPLWGIRVLGIRVFLLLVMYDRVCTATWMYAVSHSFGRSRDLAGKRHSFGRSINFFLNFGKNS